MALVNQRLESIQYNGTNSTAVIDFLDNVVFTSEAGGVLTFHYTIQETSIQLAENDYLVRNVRSGGDFYPIWWGAPTLYALMWLETQP